MHLAGFKRIRAGIRRWSSAARIARFRVDIVPCDILDRDAVARAMEGIDTVIHCAYGGRESIVQGTRNMLEAARRQEVRRFVNFSTTDVYGDREGVITEDTPLQPTGKEYGDSKMEAEQICLEYLRQGLPVVTLRPSLVYGPFSKTWVTAFADRIRSGQWRLLGSAGEGTCNLVYIEDVIRAVLLATESDRAVGQTFNINGSDLITWNEYFNCINNALGLPPLREIAPGKAKLRTTLTNPVRQVLRFFLDRWKRQIVTLYLRSECLQRLMKRTERSLQAIPSAHDLGRFGRKPIYDISKAQRLLGFEPAYSTHAGISLSIRWLIHEAYLAHG